MGKMKAKAVQHRTEYQILLDDMVEIDSSFSYDAIFERMLELSREEEFQGRLSVYATKTWKVEDEPRLPVVRICPNCDNRHVTPDGHCTICEETTIREND